MEYIAGYLTTKFKGVYRLKASINLKTNQFPRDYNGNFSDNDVYIDCNKNVRIHHWGKQILEAYIPSLQQGRNMIRFIYRDFINESNTKTNVTSRTTERNGKTVEITKETVEIIDEQLFKEELKSGIIFSIEESDSEVMFKFNANDMDKLEKYLKPKTSGASISPFSSRNLPKTDYIIPDDDLLAYKSIVEKIGKNRILELTHSTQRYLKSLANKNNSWENIKNDMSLKGLKGKEYIHSIGLWTEYIDYLNNILKEKGE